VKISVVIPCYNARSKIEACIASLHQIDFPRSEHEVLFVDDCSTDGTFDYLSAVCADVVNWHVFRLETNSGSPSRPRNFGTEVAKGEYIFYLDCDDRILPGALRQHYDVAVRENACIVRGYLLADDGEDSLLEMNRIHHWGVELTRTERIGLIISKQSTIPVSLIKRALIFNNNINWNEDIRMGEDTIFLLSVLVCSDRIEYVDSPAYVYNRRNNGVASSTQRYGSFELRNHIFVWRSAEEILKKVGLSYYEIRLYIGLTTALRAMIIHGQGDITKDDFDLFSIFLKEVWEYLSERRFDPHHIEILDTILSGDYTAFSEARKPRLLIAGYELKFILSCIGDLKKHFNIRVDEWKGHDAHDEKHSRELLQWADYIWCEWLLGNAVWYSKNRRHHQKLVIRMHRMELGRDYGDYLNYEKVHAIIAVSVLFFERLLHRFKYIPRDKVRLIPNYVALGRADTQPESDRLFKLGAVGIVPRRKGFLRMLKILVALRAKDSRYSLDVFGHSPEHFSWITRDKVEMDYYDSCRYFIEENNLSQHVSFIGHSKLPEMISERKVGFVLSTSDSGELFPGPESFHLAVLDGFAGGGQGVVLRWDGCEYIYPPSMIFDTEEEIIDHISNMTIEKFYEGSEVGRALIASRYSQDHFVNSVVSIFKE